MKSLTHCTLCPRECNVDREESFGYCGLGSLPKVARAALHFWEEPCISGTNGSGTVFFSGCNLRCVYCQNSSISSERYGKEISVERLAEIFCELQMQGAHNINLVSPTPYIPQIKKAIDLAGDTVKIPYIYNTGGYDKPESIAALKGYIDIYLTDLKYFSGELSDKYSNARDYFENAVLAIAEMINAVGKPRFNKDNIMLSGVIIRHLVLPGCRKDSEAILDRLAEKYTPYDFVLSLMSQYTPNPELLARFPELCRKLTSFEYNSVINHALDLGFENAYVQDRRSSDKKYTPPFDLSGV